MTLKELLQIQSLPVAYDRLIQNLVLDSRQVSSGDVFVALAGTQTHGQHYIDTALVRGAVAVLKEASTLKFEQLTANIPCIAIPQLSQHLGILAARLHHQPSCDMSITGITGTNGKTSVSHFIAQVLHHFVPCGVIGTLGYGIYPTLQPLQYTTPPALDLQALLAQLRAQAVKHLVMEVSSHALVQGRVNGTQFDCAIFTNLSRDHLDYHQTMTAYGEAKQRLFQMPNLKTAILNADEALSEQILARLPTSVTPITYSLQYPMAEVYATIQAIKPEGYQLTVQTPWGKEEFLSPVFGTFNLSNMLAALTALLNYDLSLVQVIPHLTTLKPVAGRMEQLHYPHCPMTVIDYAHTPSALEKVLQAVRPHCRGQLWCVFGCGGDRDQGKRPLMGEIAQHYADRVILTDDNPRHEDPEAIIADIVMGCPTPTAIIRDRALAIQYALTRAQMDDVVVIAGKGHEDYQIVGDSRFTFSDKVQVMRMSERLCQARTLKIT